MDLQMTSEDFEHTFTRGISLADFHVFYPDTDTCYRDYTRRMSEKFSSPPAGCECCGSVEHVDRKVASWEIHYQNAQSKRSNLFGLLWLLIGQAHLARATLRFRTTHSVCKRCVFRFTAKRLLTVPLFFVATIASYLPVIVAVLGTFYLIVALAVDQRPGLGAWVVVSVAVLSLPVLFWLRHRSGLLTIPIFLRPIAKRPIVFRGLARAKALHPG